MGRLIFLFALIPFALAKKVDFTGHRLISVHAKNRDDVEVLAKLQNNEKFEELDFWSEPSLVRSTDIRVSPNDYEMLRAALTKAKLNYTVVKDNVQELVDKEAESMARNSKLLRNAPDCDVEHNYCRYDQIQHFLYYLEQTSNGLVTVTPIGHSYEGRHIATVKIASDPCNPKPAIWMECGAHAREWIAVSSCMNLIKKLSNGGCMVSTFDWYVVPVHNPDGYEYSHTTDRFWRKNREPCKGGVGTDLNGNWDIGFGGGDTSGLCLSDTYRGGEAFSALETVALRDAVNNTPNVFAFFSAHCYSQLMLVPYAYTVEKPERYNDLKCVANLMMERLKAVNGTSFTVGTPPDLQYVASGAAYDYFFDVLKVPYSYMYQLRPATSGEGGFVLGTNQIGVAAAELIASLEGFVDHFSK